ncbi:hypothetical protein A8V01_18115 [Novosphingobium guangzhouense]|uniref:Uncharacterized protein n=1 Tax=Novosphingobium guangzhouense TaxID=1850347 RepID=A0A2K2G1E9_9SPHN|nr:hypothetical protein A8V01_18115 [Novosphingobium guangzhouense]
MQVELLAQEIQQGNAGVAGDFGRHSIDDDAHRTNLLMLDAPDDGKAPIYNAISASACRQRAMVVVP